MPTRRYPLTEARLRALYAQREYWREVTAIRPRGGVINHKGFAWYAPRVRKLAARLNDEIDELELLLATATVRGGGNG